MEGTRGYPKEGFMAEEAVAGNSEALRVLRQLIIYSIIYAKESRKLGLKWPRGLLLYGPPGTGKTSLVRAVVREYGATLTLIGPHTVHRAYAGESERILREAFDQASSQASEGKPSVIFIDEIDVLCPRRDSRKEQESRIVAQLLTLMDGSKASRKSCSHVAVIASTNRIWKSHIGWPYLSFVQAADWLLSVSFSLQQALDILGSTKWRVNRRVLDVVDNLWACGQPLAGLVVRNDVDRKLVKQTVMTSVYGVTYIGARDQIKRRLKERGLITDDKLLFSAACQLAMQQKLHCLHWKKCFKLHGVLCLGLVTVPRLGLHFRFCHYKEKVTRTTKMMHRQKYYVVFEGRERGIYDTKFEKRNCNLVITCFLCWICSH